MKTWRRIQKIAITVGMIYGLWLGGQCGCHGCRQQKCVRYCIVIGHCGDINVHTGQGAGKEPVTGGFLPGSKPGLALKLNI